MILHPAVLALFAGSLMSGAMLLYAAVAGVRILRRWDLSSGSGGQLELERKTYLISTLLKYVFLFQVLSLFLFIYIADGLCNLFTGAMCAAGTLNLNALGYPVLLLKLATFLAAGVWLVLNHADSKGRDYPLIRVKYAVLLAVAPLMLAEIAAQGAYFALLRPDLITSCCGSLFGAESSSAAVQLITLPPETMRVAFFAFEAAVAAASLYVILRARGGYLLAAASAAALLVGLVSTISFISLYVYQLPTHHCPFCVLKEEYGRPGYLLYGLMFFGALAGLGAGALTPFTGTPSLEGSLTPMIKRLAVASLACHVLLAAGVAWLVLHSEMVLIF